MKQARKQSQTTETLRLVIEYVPINSITPNPRNPRQHSRQQIRAIARSMDSAGPVNPLLVDELGRLIAGHGRLEALKYRGVTEVPVIRLKHLTEKQALALMLADNKLTERSTWDDGKLALILKELQETALEFDIEITGFESPEVDFRVQSLEAPDKADAADEFEPSKAPTTSQPGDRWDLGCHRLLCGNALEPNSYVDLLGQDRAGAVFVDPPYNLKVNGHVSGKGRVKHREFAMAAGEMDTPQFAGFLATFLREMRGYLAPAAISFMCMDWRHLAEAMTAVSQNEYELINFCVWAKSNGGMGSLYRSAHELILVFREKGVQHRNNVQLGRFGRNRTNVWHYPGMNSFPRRGRARSLDIHPTVKPVALVADAILDVTQAGEIVLDPFCGSGTTILAAERTGRRGYGIELDPVYVDLTVTRWQRMTGKAAIHENGKTFAEIASERAGLHVGA